MAHTRDALLHAATALLDEGGPAAVTMREVAARSDVSHNAPYKHFTDKEALLAAIAAAELAEYTGCLTEAGTLGAAADSYARRLLAYPNRFRLVYSPWTRDHADLAAAADVAWLALRATTEAAQRSDALPAGDPEALADLIRSTVHGAVELQLSGHLAKGDRPRTAETVVADLLGRLSPA